MHMADALVNTQVALAADVVAVALLGVAGYKINREKQMDTGKVPLMGVLGAFVFAAQMINFTIPGTGSSGHIIGGILLAAFLGPWSAFLTLSSVIIIQCLVFADGGLLALGSNIINMGAMSTLIAYPLVFRPIMAHRQSVGRLVAASVIASRVGIELGACGVTLETKLSGITSLPASTFLSLMTGIHLFIGLGEGLATAAILSFVAKSRPELILDYGVSNETGTRRSMKKVLLWFGLTAAVLGGGLAFFASEYPDGLEWSIQQLSGTTELETEFPDAVSAGAESIQQTTAVMPDYANSLSGILGAAMVVILVWVFTSLIMGGKHSSK